MSMIVLTVYFQEINKRNNQVIFSHINIRSVPFLNILSMEFFLFGVFFFKNNSFDKRYFKINRFGSSILG